MDRTEMQDLAARTTLALVDELHQMETERDAAIREAGIASEVAADAIDALERCVAGRTVPVKVIQQMKDKLNKM